MQFAFKIFKRSVFLVLLTFFLSVVIFRQTADASSQQETPILISEPDSTRAVVGASGKRGYDSSTKVFAAGKPIQFTVYLTNLNGLLEGEGATAFRADAQDAARRRFPLEITGFELAPKRQGVYALALRLNPEIGDAGDVLLRVTWRGMASNRVRLSVGHASKEPSDDAGAQPTPFPAQDSPVITPENIVYLPYTPDRVRFINQATFGLTPQLEARLRRISLATWITEQMEQRYDSNGIERYSSFSYPNLPLQIQTPSATCNAGCLRDNYTMYPLQNWFFREALYGEDQQLRRRVSWALSQVWVVSGRETQQPSRMLPYVKILDKHAFGNYRDLMVEMTLNPAMGNYLDMARSTAQNPNENYAREILQLFSIGLDKLSINGTPVLDNQGNRIPTYNQDVVNGFSKVFTGWSLCNTTCANSQPGILNFRDPMVLDPASHDITQKQVLIYDGATSIIPAGQTAQQDLDQAINNIFNHPNVGPFVGKILIQQLVTSNPTPAYVERVARTFNGEAPYGRGERGDMKAVIKAILLDPEARGNIKNDPDYGQLKEPVLYATKFLRPFNPTAQANANANCGGLSDGVINPATAPLEQDAFNAPTVFNYYPFDYILPGTNLNAPEFGIFSTGTALKRPNFINQMTPPGSPGLPGGIPAINPNLPNLANHIPCGTRIDLTRLQTLSEADATGGQLVDTLNKELLHGLMSAVMRTEILNAVQQVGANNHVKRARTALYLVATSPQYQVQR